MCCMYVCGICMCMCGMRIRMWHVHVYKYVVCMCIRVRHVYMCCMCMRCVCSRQMYVVIISKYPQIILNKFRVLPSTKYTYWYSNLINMSTVYH